MNRGRSLRAGTLACAILTLGFSGAVTAQEPASVKVGYAISKTGPNAGGASITQIPNYQLWVKEVNDKGGLMLGGKRVKIEVIEYDDRSNSEEAVRAVERLIEQDKVDLLFSAVGHRPQSRGRPGLQQIRLSATRLQRSDRPRAGTGKTLAEQLLVPRHLKAICRCAGRPAVADAQGRQDQRQHRHGQHRRRFRHRSVEGRARRL